MHRRDLLILLLLAGAALLYGSLFPSRAQDDPLPAPVPSWDAANNQACWAPVANADQYPIGFEPWRADILYYSVTSTTDDNNIVTQLCRVVTGLRPGDVIIMSAWDNGPPARESALTRLTIPTPPTEAPTTVPTTAPTEVPTEVPTEIPSTPTPTHTPTHTATPTHTLTPTHTPTPTLTPTTGPLPAHVSAGPLITETDANGVATRHCRSLAGLQAGDRLKVRASSDDPRYTDSPWSSSVSVAAVATFTPTLTPTSTPTPSNTPTPTPTKIPLVAPSVTIATDGASVSWTAVTGATGYQVRWRLQGSSEWESSLHLPTTTLSLALSGLLEGSTQQQSRSTATAVYEMQVGVSGTTDEPVQWSNTFQVEPPSNPPSALPKLGTPNPVFYSKSGRVCWDLISGAPAVNNYLSTFVPTHQGAKYVGSIVKENTQNGDQFCQQLGEGFVNGESVKIKATNPSTHQDSEWGEVTLSGLATRLAAPPNPLWQPNEFSWGKVTGAPDTSDYAAKHEGGASDTARARSSFAVGPPPPGYGEVQCNDKPAGEGGKCWVLWDQIDVGMRLSIQACANGRKNKFECNEHPSNSPKASIEAHLRSVRDSPTECDSERPNYVTTTVPFEHYLNASERLICSTLRIHMCAKNDYLEEAATAGSYLAGKIPAISAFSSEISFAINELKKISRIGKLKD